MLLIWWNSHAKTYTCSLEAIIAMLVSLVKKPFADIGSKIEKINFRVLHYLINFTVKIDRFFKFCNRMLKKVNFLFLHIKCLKYSDKNAIAMVISIIYC